MTQLRLLKINVQPVFVLDDGEHLTRQEGSVLEVHPFAWSNFAVSFIEDIANACKEFDEINKE